MTRAATVVPPLRCYSIASVFGDSITTECRAYWGPGATVADVFISYSKQARHLTQELDAWLKDQKRTVWWDDELTGGDRYPTEIRRQLLGAKAGIVLWSEPAVKSDWVYAEAVEAARCGNIIPVIADDVSPADLPLPFNAGDHVVRLSDRKGLRDSIDKRISGILEPVREQDERFDPRWAGLWLLDPHQLPYRSEDAIYSPVSLLHARHALVPFEELAGELRDFLDWASGPRKVCGRVLEGAGGLGKTRLMIELCAHLSANEGWLTGFLPEQIICHGNELREDRLRALIEDRTSDRPLLIVVDYAETRRTEIEWLCHRLLTRRDKAGTRARIVLISRAAGEWWQDLFADPNIQKLFSKDNLDPDIVNLSHLSRALTAARRKTLFDKSVASLREVIVEAGRSPPSVLPSDLQLQRVCSTDDNGRPLAIQLEAVLHLYGEAADDERLSIDKLLDKVLALETRGWDRRLKLSGDRQARGALARGVCQTTLVLGVDDKRNIVDLLKQTEQCDDGQADDIHDRLHKLYGKPTGGLFPLEPDLIGEHHVGDTIDDRLLDVCLAWASADRKRRRSILTVLNRASRENEHGEKAKSAETQLERLLRDDSLIDDLRFVADGTPGILKALIAERRKALAAPSQELAQTTSLEESARSPSQDRIIRVEAAEARETKVSGSSEPEPAGGNRIFLSYAHADHEAAELLATVLKRIGFNVAMDLQMPLGSSVIEYLRTHIEESDKVVALLSPSYLESRFAREEWMTALRNDPLNRNGRLLPIRIKPCRPDGILGSLAYLDLVPIKDDPAQIADAVRRVLSASPVEEAEEAGDPSGFVNARSAILHSNIKPQPSFVPRQAELMAIHSALWSPEALAVIAGRGGAGKSTLAREYGWQARDGYAGVWWLRADTEALLVEDLVALGSQLSRGIRQSVDLEEAARGVLDFLSNGGFEKPWLLIFDNVSDWDLVEKWRTAGNIQRLITTRLKGSVADEGAAEILIDTWGIEESADYIIAASGRQGMAREEAERLAELLGCLPLVLSVASAQLRENPATSVAQYLEQLALQVSGVGSVDDLRSVGATWRLQMKAVETRAPGASAILSICAFVDADEIPVEFLKNALTYAATQDQGSSVKAERLEALLAALAEHLLLNHDKEFGTVSIHRVVQAVARESAAPEQARWTGLAALALRMTFPEPNAENGKLCAQLARHVSVLADFVTPEDETYDLARTVLEAGDALDEYLDVKDLQIVFGAANALFRRLADHDSQNGLWQVGYAHSHDRIGEVLVAQGSLSRALDSFQAGHEIKRRLADADPNNAGWQRDRSVSLDQIGDVLVAQGNLSHALDTFQAAHEIKRRLADADPNNAGWQRDRSVSLDRIGDVLVAQGNLSHALDTFQAAHEIKRRLADADPNNAGWQRDRSVSLNKIADVLATQGNLISALQAYQESLAIADRLATADPGNAVWQRDLAVSHYRIGDVLRDQGDLARAVDAYHASLAIAERLAAADHGNAGWQRDLSVAYNKIGDVRVAQGDLDSATDAFRASLAIAERLAAADTSNASWQRDLALSLGRVGSVEAQRGQSEEARAKLIRGREILAGLGERTSGSTSFAREISWFDKLLDQV